MTAHDHRPGATGRDELEDRLTLENPTVEPARVVLLGGPPFTEEIVIWWNFVRRTHRGDRGVPRAVGVSRRPVRSRDGYVGPTERIPAPPMPRVRLTARSNPAH